MANESTTNPDSTDESGVTVSNTSTSSDAGLIPSLEAETDEKKINLPGKFMANGYPYTIGPIADTRYKVSDNEFQEAQAKLTYLKDLVEKRLKMYTDDRKGARRWAFIFTMFSSVFAGTVTVLLGWKFVDPTSGYRDLFANIALVLSAFITVLTVLSKFWDAKQLWVRYTDTENLLRQLLSFIEYTEQGLGELKALRLAEVEALHYKYNSIIRATDDLIHDVRSQN